VIFLFYGVVMRLNVPFLRQQTDYTCGPTALQMVLAYFGKTVATETVCAMAGTTEKTGTRRRGMITTLQILGFQTHFHSNSSLEEVKFFLDQCAPVIVSYREFAEKESHFGVLVGYEGETLILHDPYEEKPFMPVPEKLFLEHWYGKHTKFYTRWLLAVSDKPLIPFGGDIVNG
jgi:predicted double-glycine peptidase